MIFIVVKYRVRGGDREGFLTAAREFTEATRAEPGNKWFEWSLSVEDPHEVVLVEAFEDDAAAAHVESDHFAKGLETMKPWLTETPKIISRTIDGNDWDEMGELKIS
ncbi:putative quinol monooxygenase [Rothia nasisuis]|uniref:putative quinol monooxygenase n=1 Tax=Rothia nasisuis TaxID=2109647 RepID=UPI001F383BA8|nr:putative quinol monooxygenase [Rothia nasisuis]